LRHTRWHDQIAQYVEILSVLLDQLSIVPGYRWTAKSQADGDFVSGRVECERVDAAGKRFGGLAEPGVNAAAVVRVEEDAGAIFTIRKAILFGEETAHADECFHTGRHIVSFGPVLTENALSLLLGYQNLMLPTAVAATVAGVFLDDR